MVKIFVIVQKERANAIGSEPLVKNYSNLFFKLSITVEEYLAYKSKRLLDTAKQKKDKIDDSIFRVSN